MEANTLCPPAKRRSRIKTNITKKPSADYKIKNKSCPAGARTKVTKKEENMGGMGVIIAIMMFLTWCYLISPYAEKDMREAEKIRANMIETDSGFFCGKCNTELDPLDKFCPGCSRRLIKSKHIKNQISKYYKNETREKEDK